MKTFLRRGVALTAAGIAMVLGFTPAAEAACYTTVRVLVPVERVRYVYPTYQEPVYEPRVSTEWQYVLTGYSTSVSYQPREVTETIQDPVYVYMYTHWNYWSSGRVTSCSGYGYSPNCGSHGSGWIGHDTDYWSYVSYYRERTVTRTVYDAVEVRTPNYQWMQVPTTTYVLTWRTVTSPTPVAETYTAFEYQNITVETECGTTTPPPIPTPAPLPTTTVTPTPVPTPTPPATTSFTLRYNANGGTGTIVPLTRTSGTTVQLATGGVTRAGFELIGWSDGTRTYAPGDSYRLTLDVTMRAVWDTSGELRPS